MRAVAALTISAFFCFAGFMGWILWTELGPKTFSGEVYDCKTGQPIEGASVELWQQTLFTWDEIHKYVETTGPDGRFRISYDVGSGGVHARTSKDGYLLSDESGIGKVRIGLIENRPDEADLRKNGEIPYSVRCKRNNECWHTVVSENGSVFANTCGNLESMKAD